MKSLRDIPNIGKATEKTLLKMGYASAEDLKKKSAEELYAEECRMKGFLSTAASFIFTGRCSII